MNKDEILEEQIGAMGASEFDTPAETPAADTGGLGKAKYFGVKKHNTEDVDKPSIRTGWVEVDRDEFEDRGQFYPSDWRFYVKPASVNDIKNYSSIDEERPEQVQEVINEMLKNNIKITNGTGTIPWGKLNDWDRLFMLTKIREYTFVKGESEISFIEPCGFCDNDVKFELKSGNLKYDIPEQDIINEYFDPETRTWTIDPHEYDINGPLIKFHIPTIDVDAVVLKWSIEQAREQQRKSPNTPVKINESFIKFLPWMLPRVTRDDKINDRFIRDAEAVYRGWGVEMFGLAEEILDKISVTLEDRLRAICPHCGEEVSAPVRFQNGLRSLFIIQSGRKKFGEK